MASPLCVCFCFVYGVIAVNTLPHLVWESLTILGALRMVNTMLQPVISPQIKYSCRVLVHN